MRYSDSGLLHPMFIERWSPRAFINEPIDSATLDSVFEAARWSPSCFNEQPWLFVYANTKDDLRRFQSVLAESNQIWANQAPVLAFAFSKRQFSHNQKPNRWADFDTGAAWMALTLQANHLGLATHGMGGYDIERAYTVTGVDASVYQVLCAIAIGKPGPATLLPKELREREQPSERKPLPQVAYAGCFK